MGCEAEAMRGWGSEVARFPAEIEFFGGMKRWARIGVVLAHCETLATQSWQRREAHSPELQIGHLMGAQDRVPNASR